MLAAPGSSPPLPAAAEDLGARRASEARASPVSPRRRLLGHSPPPAHAEGALSYGMVTTSGPPGGSPFSGGSRGSSSPVRGSEGWAKRTPSPAAETHLAAGVSAAPAVAVTASDVAGQRPLSPGRGSPPAPSLLAAGLLPDAAIAAGSALPLHHHVAGKRKVLEGTNSMELIHDAHIKHYMPVPEQDQQQQDQQQLEQQQEQQQQEQEQEQAHDALPKQQSAQEQQQAQQQRDVDRPQQRDQAQWPPALAHERDHQPGGVGQEQGGLVLQQQPSLAAGLADADMTEAGGSQPPLLPLLQAAQPGLQPPQPQRTPPDVDAADVASSPFCRRPGSKPSFDAALQAEQQQQQQQQHTATAAAAAPQSPHSPGPDGRADGSRARAQSQSQSPTLPPPGPPAAAAARAGSNSPSPGSAGGAGSASPEARSSDGGGGSSDMRPPSLVDMARRVLGARPELFGPPGHGGAASTTRGGSVMRSASGDASMATASQDGACSSGGGGHGGGLFKEPSLNSGALLQRALSGAASLEGWLLAGASSGSPRSLAAAAHLIRTGSNMSTGSGSVGRQGSVAFGQAGPLSRGSSLDKQGSFGGWPADAPGSGFSWPQPTPMRTISEDSLKMDIQVLAPVVPEAYPPEPPPGSAAAEHDGRLRAMAAQQAAAAAAVAHVDRDFFAKVAAWEDELVDMLEQQAAPVAIRQIVAVFKDRIHTERDKSEFKALCDKWTGVVEYPAGSGIKCLAIKSWMRGGRLRDEHANGARHEDDDDDWD